MRFDLTIQCGNAAFAPIHDDAGEEERYSAASAEVRRILRDELQRERLLSGDRVGFLRDANGDRCGQWRIRSGDASDDFALFPAVTLPASVVERALQFMEGFADDPAQEGVADVCEMLRRALEL